MSSARKTSIAAGSLFVIGTVAVLAADAIVPALTGDGYLQGLAGQQQRLGVAVICYLLAAGASASIAVALYPLLRRVSAGLALASVVFRAVEGVFYAVAVVGLLSVPPLARQAAAATPEQRPALRALADSLLSLRDHATLVGVVAFCVGALLCYLLLYRSQLVPRWLSGWGVVATLLMLSACVLAIFADRAVTGYVPLILPIAVQELALAGWLLVKGFDDSAVAALAPSEFSAADAPPAEALAAAR